MALTIAMVISYIPFMIWIMAEYKKQKIQSQRTH